MKYFKGTRAEIAALRAETNKALGYPKQPDFVGANCPPGLGVTTDAVHVIEEKDGTAKMLVHARLEKLARGELAEKLAEPIRVALAEKVALAAVEVVKAIDAEPVEEPIKDIAEDPKLEAPLTEAEITKG